MSSLLHLLLPAMALGVIQGLTEFLPVSSSGHLVVASHLLRFAEPSLLFDTLLHAATLLPVLWLYRVDLWAILRGLGRLAAPARAWREDRGFRLMLCVAIGTAPTALIGLTLGGLFTRLFASPAVVGVTFLLTGGILMLSRLSRQRPALDEPDDSHLSLSATRALWVGLAQGMAITPGISRSGTTITAALLIGVERTMAARFSFLLSVPAIVGAVLLQLRGPLSTTAGWWVYLAGSIAAAVSGYLALRWLVGLVRRGSFHRFAFYVWPLGLAVLAYTLLV